jgi:hypothetical protein
MMRVLRFVVKVGVWVLVGLFLWAFVCGFRTPRRSRPVRVTGWGREWE